MYVYKPQLKPQGRARVASGEPPIAFRHVVPPYTSAGSTRALAGVVSWWWMCEGVRWEAARLCSSSSSSHKIIKQLKTSRAACQPVVPVPVIHPSMSRRTSSAALEHLVSRASPCVNKKKE